MLSARVCDPQGPRWTRAAVFWLGAALVVFGPFLPVDSAVRSTLALVGVAILLSRRQLHLRHAARDARIAVGSAGIEIVDAGLLAQSIRASDVVAASTARTANGVALAIVRSDCPERPVLLDFEADHDLDRVRRALGIGHSGFGEIAWPTVRTYEAVPGSAMLLACGWLTIAVCAALGQPWLGLTLGLLVAPLTGIALLVSAILGSDPGPRVALTAYGVLLAEPPDRLTCVPYEEVTDVRVDPQGMTVATRSTPFVIRMRAALAEEREHLAAQILSAARRSRGDGPPRPGLPASLAVLAPRGEATRVWLERIDAAAASLASLGAYRRSELNAQDLFGALESPDAPAPMRAAAARVLARVVPEEAKTRVAQVLATEHDAYARACIRIALEEDVDVAARELERLESA